MPVSPTQPQAGISACTRNGIPQFAASPCIANVRRPEWVRSNMEMFSEPLTSIDKRGLLAGGFVIAVALVLPFHLFHRTSGWSYRDLVAQIHGNSTDAQVLRTRVRCSSLPHLGERRDVASAVSATPIDVSFQRPSRMMLRVCIGPRVHSSLPHMVQYGVQCMVVRFAMVSRSCLLSSVCSRLAVKHAGLHRETTFNHMADKNTTISDPRARNSHNIGSPVSIGAGQSNVE